LLVMIRKITPLKCFSILKMDKIFIALFWL